MRKLKLPPYGSELAARLRYSNLPLWVIVFAGRDAWERAKRPMVRVGDCHPLVWDGKKYRWPVSNCHVLVEVDTGPSLEQIRALAGELLIDGAAGVLCWWLHWSESRPIAYDPDGKGRYLTADEINQAVWSGAQRHAA